MVLLLFIFIAFLFFWIKFNCDCDCDCGYSLDCDLDYVVVEVVVKGNKLFRVDLNMLDVAWCACIYIIKVENSIKINKLH